MSTGAVVARILTQYSDKGSKQAQKDIKKLGKNIDAFGNKAAKSIGLVAAATAALAIKIGKDAVNAAIEDQRAQALLANTLAKTTGATAVQIAAVEKHIDALEMLSTVSDTELRQSFADIVAVTGNVTNAMKIQTVALDVAKGKTLDLNVVSKAFTKAAAGSFDALKKILPGIDANIIKNKDLAAAMAYATSIYGGSAEAFGDTEPLKRLQIAYGRVLETLGGALLPVVKEFTTYLINDVLPNVNKWVEANREELAESFRRVAGLARDFLVIAVKIGKWASDHVILFKTIAGIIATMFVVNKISTFITGVSGMITVLKGLKTQADLTNASTSKIGLIGKVGAAAVAIPIFGELYSMAVRQADAEKDLVKLEKQKETALLIQDAISVGILTRRIKNLKAEIALTAKLMKERQKLNGVMIPYKEGLLTVSELKVVQDAAAAARIEAAAAAASLKATVKSLAAEKLRASVLAKLAKMKVVPGKGSPKLGKGVVPTSSLDPAAQEAIQFEAVRLNLIKQGNIAEAARVAAISKNLEKQLEANKALARYNDLLAALADKTISSEEVLLLSKKWGMTIEATQSYIQTLLAVADQTISDDEITNLAKAWGVSKEKAGMYLDFFNALNDGKLSDAEIAKLQSRWSLSSKEVQIYADLITKASDYVLSDAEITALGKNWGLTTAEVIEYIKKLGQPVTFSGTLIDPATQAELGWKSALAALLAYQAALAGKGVTAVVIPPVVVVPKAGDPVLGGSKTDSAAAAASAAASKKAADAYAAAKAKGDMDAAAKAAAGVTPSALASQESGAIGAASIAAQLRAAEQAKAAADAAAKQASSLAAFKAKEAADAAASKAAADAMDYDEKFRMRSAQGVMSANSGFKGLTASSTTNVTVNVAGSVTSENDLVATVRNGLLRGQINGQTLTLEAV